MEEAPLLLRHHQNSAQDLGQKIAQRPMRRFMPPGPGVFPGRRDAAVWCIQVNKARCALCHRRRSVASIFEASCWCATFARAKAQFGLLWPPGLHSAGWDGHFPTRMHPPSGLGASERRAKASFHLRWWKFGRRRQQQNLVVLGHIWR